VLDDVLVTLNEGAARPVDGDEEHVSRAKVLRRHGSHVRRPREFESRAWDVGRIVENTVVLLLVVGSDTEHPWAMSGYEGRSSVDASARDWNMLNRTFGSWLVDRSVVCGVWMWLASNHLCSDLGLTSSCSSLIGIVFSTCRIFAWGITSVSVGSLIATRPPAHVENDGSSAVAERLADFRVSNDANNCPGGVVVLERAVKDDRSESSDLCVVAYAVPVVDTYPVANAMVLGVSEMDDVLSARDSLRDGSSQDMNRRVCRDLMSVRACDYTVPPLSECFEINLILELGSARVVSGRLE